MTDELEYMSGFGNEFATEALKGALPVGKNSPQKVAYGLYAEQMTGSAFTAPRSSNKRTWQYRIRPSVLHKPFSLHRNGMITGAAPGPATPNQLRWDPLPIPEERTDFIEGWHSMTACGSPESMIGISVHHYVANADMKDRYFSFGSDSDFKSSQEESADASSERRLSYLQFGLGLIAENPIQGAGYRSFVILYPESEFIRFDNPVNEHDLNRVAHNVYLETFVGVGLLGTSAFVLMLFLAWRYFRRAIALLEPGTFAWATAQALEYALIAYCVSSIFISSEQFKQLWYILGMSSALLHYAMFLQNKKNSSNAPIRSSIAN